MQVSQEMVITFLEQLAVGLSFVSSVAASEDPSVPELTVSRQTGQGSSNLVVTPNHHTL